MKCKHCGSKRNVVKRAKDHTYRGETLPAGQVCDDCMKAFKEAIDLVFSERSYRPEST